MVLCLLCQQEVDEKLLYDALSAFWVIVTNPKVNLLCIWLCTC
jgi:hypothetical protein